LTESMNLSIWGDRSGDRGGSPGLSVPDCLSLQPYGVLATHRAVSPSYIEERGPENRFKGINDVARGSAPASGGLFRLPVEDHAFSNAVMNSSREIPLWLMMARRVDPLIVR